MDKSTLSPLTHDVHNAFVSALVLSIVLALVKKPTDGQLDRS